MTESDEHDDLNMGAAASQARPSVEARNVTPVGERLGQCPQCRYPLAGLAEVGRCPECAYQYDDRIHFWWIEERPVAVTGGVPLVRRWWFWLLVGFGVALLYARWTPDDEPPLIRFGILFLALVPVIVLVLASWRVAPNPTHIGVDAKGISYWYRTQRIKTMAWEHIDGVIPNRDGAKLSVTVVHGPIVALRRTENAYDVHGIADCFKDEDDLNRFVEVVEQYRELAQ